MPLTTERPFQDTINEVFPPLPTPQACLIGFLQDMQMGATHQLGAVDHKFPPAGQDLRSWRTTEKARLQHQIDTLQKYRLAAQAGSHQYDAEILVFVDERTRMRTDEVNACMAELAKKKGSFPDDDKFFKIASEIGVRRSIVTHLTNVEEVNLAKEDLRQARIRQYGSQRGAQVQRGYQATYELLKMDMTRTWLQVPNQPDQSKTPTQPNLGLRTQAPPPYTPPLAPGGFQNR